jgi:hypothetical protein
VNDDVEEFARSQRRATRLRMVIMGVVIASPFLWLGWRCRQEHQKKAAWEEEYRQQNRLSDAEKAELDRLLPELRGKLERAQKAFAEDVTPAKLETVVPGEDPCGSYRSEAGQLDAKLGTRYAALAGGSIEKFKIGEPVAVKRLAGAVRTLDALVEEIKSEDDPTKSQLSRARSMAKDAEGVVFFVGETSDPVVMADSYIPGTVRGMAFLYSPEARKIVCAAHVEVQNAAEVKVSYTTSQYDVTGMRSKQAAAQAELQVDLASRMDSAIAQGMRAVR